MGTQPSVYALQGKVQHYAWGGFTFIPQLLGVGSEVNKPYAEYWLGAHPLHSAVVKTETGNQPLVQLIHEQPAAILGTPVAQEYGSLPYLLKVLDVRQMLSIQVHPDKASAEAAFEAEDSKGVALDAPHRNYKDRNHKPELMVALGDFWLLHGFKPAALLIEVLSSEPDFEFLLDTFNREGYEGLYKKVMMMPQEEVNAILKPIMDRIVPLYHNGELQKKHEDFWAARAVDTFCKNGQYDRGIFSIYFFNLLHLQKGEGIYQAAGLPHAYLEGQNMEIMANSDNVLRAGLTDKHIDIAELMKHVRFEPTEPQIIPAGTESVEKVYGSPAAEFQLSRLLIQGGAAHNLVTNGPEILFVLKGGVNVRGNENDLKLRKGEAAFATSGTNVTIEAEADAEIYRAAVPQS